MNVHATVEERPFRAAYVPYSMRGFSPGGSRSLQRLPFDALQTFAHRTSVVNL